MWTKIKDNDVPDDLCVGDEVEVPGTIWGEPVKTKITRVIVFYETEAFPGRDFRESILAYRRQATKSI
jgi:hypothetical protein